MKHRHLALLVAALVAVSSVALTTSSAFARPDDLGESTSTSSKKATDGFAPAAAGFMIQSRMNPAKCLDIRGGNPGNGASVAMWQCVGVPQQRWYFSDGYLKSYLNHRCLDVADGNSDNGAAINMWDCNQRWGWNGVDLRNGIKCLDIAGWNPRDGAALQMWDCLGGTNQAWRLVY